ncbi:MAG TPA: hypothetical protein VFE63_14000 [Roseiarcus sp.]|nr:hypothetical protein [Roseiarcus sp.]
MARYQTFESNPGVAFSAATPPTTVALREAMVPDRDLRYVFDKTDVERLADLIRLLMQSPAMGER